MGWRHLILGEEKDPCPHPNPGKYCPDCGLLMQPPRYSLDEFMGSPAAWIDKGFRRTLFGLLLHPGRSIRTYLFQDRRHLVKPLVYLVIAFAISLSIRHLLGESRDCAPDDGFCKMWEENASNLQLLEISLFAIAYRISFRRTGLNLWEYGVGFAYIVAQAILISAGLRLAFGFLEPIARDLIAFAGNVTYLITATIRFLQIRGRWPMLGAILLGLVVMFGYLIFISLLGEAWLDDTPAAAPQPEIAAPPG